MTDNITKCEKSFLQSTLGFLLKIATVSTKRVSFITKDDSYDKLRRLSQNALGQRMGI